MTDILTVQSLDAGYGAAAVLHDINLTVGSGQFVSVIAPNGTGKSTLLKTVAGILPPLGGTIFLNGVDQAGLSRREMARQIAVVGADVTNFDYTALQMVSMGRFPHLRRFAGPSAADRGIVQATMEAVGVWNKRLSPCGELSQGERQKVIIARALAQQPRLLLLDEPTAHLDIGNQYGILRFIRAIARQRDMAVVAVIHDINLALTFSTHLFMLRGGRTLAYGEPGEVATAANLKKLYGMDFTLCRDAAATYVRPCLEQENDDRLAKK